MHSTWGYEYLQEMHIELSLFTITWLSFTLLLHYIKISAIKGMSVIQLSIKTLLFIFCSVFNFTHSVRSINVISNFFLILINPSPPLPLNPHINARIMFHVINKKWQTVLPIHGIPLIELLPISRFMSTHYQMKMSSTRVSYIEGSGVRKSWAGSRHLSIYDTSPGNLSVTWCNPWNRRILLCYFLFLQGEWKIHKHYILEQKRSYYVFTSFSENMSPAK